jgi:cytochrome P450
MTRYYHSHTGRIVLKSVYDYDIQSENDYYVALQEENFQLFNETFCSGKFWLVDVFPWLKNIPSWTPGFKFHQVGKQAQAIYSQMINKPYNSLRRKMEEGAAQPCVVTRALDRFPEDQITPEVVEVIKNAAASAYGAAQDTSASALISFMLAMSLHPEQQKRAQQEIDAVTQGSRLPNLEDKDALPYLHCILVETLRWAPPAPMGLPHRSMKEDVYMGYYIPEGTLIQANIWWV